jgi:hypothetical protein
MSSSYSQFQETVLVLSHIRLHILQRVSRTNLFHTWFHYELKTKQKNKINSTPITNPESLTKPKPCQREASISNRRTCGIVQSGVHMGLWGLNAILLTECVDVSGISDQLSHTRDCETDKKSVSVQTWRQSEWVSEQSQHNPMTPVSECPRDSGPNLSVGKHTRIYSKWAILCTKQVRMKLFKKILRRPPVCKWLNPCNDPSAMCCLGWSLAQFVVRQSFAVTSVTCRPTKLYCMFLFKFKLRKHDITRFVTCEANKLEYFILNSN